ncbi:maleylpyruvate isomerase [Streptomyces agglomeratus]|uniref:DinB family protein n=1 Tax=Streptomyces agglomeratus TaxID=285458 RepID=UPI000854865F|nr:DinB family protein [Streptomyces agglomeratus]OEJ43016.1 maleylpyruvate isomerase [Streptomyces agglomeratus]
MADGPSSPEQQAVLDDYDRARRTFHALLGEATPADLARQTSGTRWTNRQLLWHMLFGYCVTRVLLGLARGFSRMPRSASQVFARVLDAGTRPFDVINYLGPCGAVRVFGPGAMGAAFDRITDSLARRLAKESERDLARGMHCPGRWDPFFKDFMTLADLYRYPTQHFDFHHRQLTLGERG